MWQQCHIINTTGYPETIHNQDTKNRERERERAKMKFGKELASQMVQEWQGAYLDYNTLKRLLKDLLIYRKQKGISTYSGHSGRVRSLKRKQSLYRAFSGLTGRYRGGSPKIKDDDNEEQPILVNAVKEEEEEGTESYYQTMFLRLNEKGGEQELVFFRRLDEEFNKVLKFYREKVQAVKTEAEGLSKQMDALIALRITVDKPCVSLLQHFGPEVMAAAPSPRNSSPASITASVNDENQGVQRMEVIQEVEMISEDIDEISEAEKEEKKDKMVRFRPAPLEILSAVRINIDPETPVSTLRNVLGSSKSELSFSKEELRKAEERLGKAFVGFYQQLRLLKSYCFLNMLAVSKIMKKYDKITSRGASKSYLQMVDKSDLGTSDEVNKLIERTEATFIKHFANGNRRKGMKTLRPEHRQQKHRNTFFLGLYTGCSIALMAAITVVARLRNLHHHEGRDQYMENVFPLYSLFAYIVFHMFMYGSNTYLWRRYRVNYPFIFGFRPGTELGFREVLLIASGLSVLALSAVLSNLDMEMDERTGNFKVFKELIPLILVIAVLLITFCPFNIVYRSSRFFLLRCAWHCFCAPLYKVTLPDFFLADQLTSQVQAFRSLQFYVCYYGWGDFKRRTNKCASMSSYEALLFVVAIIPFWARFLQCLRRLFEEKDSMQGYNALKYFSTIVALVMRTLYDLKRITFWRIMAASTSGITTIYSTYWDIVIDWGLLQKKSKNPWLRDKLLISNKAVYYIAIVANILLRLVWMQLVLNLKETAFLHKNAMVAVVACLEILRRGIWNFFRLENEHYNNVGKYRAFKSVPLPFHYEDEKIL
ncbi:phosphate transporter PHO1 homolog 9-like [Andrographis paniculata]|uniref:phosphate transporter PHO1 homolog 9-like n=1 Tax=Andrographis paniculata TaxID=175694 RepID=UPI0021E7581A|nr:phosphate transporter PHO1 homolog 9-like [Andrographis paniculata]